MRVEERYLIDTSLWINALRPGIKEDIKAFMETVIAKDRVVLPGLVKMELLGGVRNDKEFEELNGYLDSLPYLPMADQFWQKAAHHAFHLRRRGRSIPYTDILIATMALEHQLIIAHMDNHYTMMADVLNLQVKTFGPEVSH